MPQLEEKDSISQRRLAWLVWGLAAIFYFSDYLARVAPSVMHRNLQIDFGINEAGFGILMASFYIPYVMMQVPVGLTVDRLSIRTILTVMALITALGCLVFGLANGLLVASIGRMMIGFSAAFAFVSALRLATSWFPLSMLGLLAGLTQALGMLGASAGQAPLSFLIMLFGWRYSMISIAILFVVLAALLYHFVQDRPRAFRDPLILPMRFKISQSLGIVLSHKQTWINALYAGFLFAPTAVIGEAYGPAYLQYGRGLNQHVAAFAIGLIFIGWGISGPFSGWLSDRIGRRKPLMVLSALFGIILTLLFVFLPTMNKFSAYALFLCYGLTNTGVALAYAVSTEIQVKQVTGTSIAFTNMISIFIGASMQPLVGKLIDLSSGIRGYNAEQLVLTDFQASFWLLPCCSLIALILACRIKETYCKSIY